MVDLPIVKFRHHPREFSDSVEGVSDLDLAS